MAKLSGILLFDEAVVLQAIIPKFPTPALSFIYTLTAELKTSLSGFLNAYKKFLHLTPGASTAILKLAKDEEDAKRTVNAVNNHNGNGNGNGNGGKKKKGRHGGRYPKSKYLRNDRYCSYPCYNCGKEGHSLFQHRCTKYAEVKKLLSDGAKRRDVFNKYKDAFEKRSVNSIHYHHLGSILIVVVV
ncbi:unnamed protein product [Ambrosiozyma monospora]|uniref:Unnamed protein product n=1 Tax=Ambrosiozyma monospora TaxID=43982 RepID=A0ACB5T2N3_AMBMO|nr:unnamed protein product [Ambrosiozyma monospora]